MCAWCVKSIESARAAMLRAGLGGLSCAERGPQPAGAAIEAEQGCTTPLKFVVVGHGAVP